ncbi:MAG: hypothetical protein QW502_01935 [Candidatus Bathyarchaeia archaeon]|nr:hypothetical protein [Candidatus Bathyarchaeota archaeon]
MSMEELRAILRKAVSLTLIFNSVASLLSSIGVLCGIYVGVSFIFICSPCSLEGLPLFFVAATSILNIAPAKTIGRVNLRRIMFHHYVYGLLSIAAYFALSIPHLLLVDAFSFSRYQVYASLFLYWGITLTIDDLADVSPRIARLLNLIGNKVRKAGWLIQKVHLISSLISVFAAIHVLVCSLESRFLLIDNSFLSFLHALLIVNLLITAVYGLKICGEKVWLKSL